jgi:uncharacterized membrane-anchored protein
VRTLASPKVNDVLSKVAPVTLAFWVVKICATTLGETGGDALSMTLNLGYAISTLIFLTFFAVTLFLQLRAKGYHPFYYWAVVVATTTVGTTTSDLLDRTLGLGYVKSSIIEFSLVLAVLAVWHFATGSISVDHVTSRRNESFYWITILVANTLGTALGDFVATTTGLGFEGGALVFAGLLAIVAAIFFLADVPTSILFWAAYVLTRPLGATLGDTLTKAHASGGLALNRIAASLVIVAVMAAMVILTQRRGRHSTAEEITAEPAPKLVGVRDS